ncbi:nucleoporin interacting component Nup93/Nic96 [Blakeslea trispora]|nr:nucleoporin interacting component Nup93/Nic96 [Blakeslea trispora]
MNYEKTRDALEYDCLITLYQSTDMKKVCYQLIVSHITSLDDYKQATGDPSVYQTGYIKRLKPLLGVYSMEDEREYNREVLARVANHFKLDHRYKDVVSIDMLMGDFDSALSELNQQLNDAIERYVSYILKYACYSRSSEQDLIQYCTLFIQTHQHQETALSRTCYYLLLILQACTAHQQGRLEDALRFIKQLNVIPFEGQNFVAISHHVDVYNHSLDMMSKKHLPGVILMTLDILASFYKNTLNTSMSLLSQEQGAAMIQQRESYKAGIRSVMSFTGIISADIRPEILQKIHRKITEIH